MKHACLSLLFVCAIAGAALADDAAIEIPQVPTGAAPVGNAERSIKATNSDTLQDHQKDVLSNPEISAIGRANALTGGGGNTATVVQQGMNNRSSVRQSGHNNQAVQIQKGKHNDLMLEQNGNHNRSREKQTGDYNHKVKIQNGAREESTILNEDAQPDAATR